MKKLLVITVDENDADYNTSINDVTDEQLESLKPVFAAIKAFRPYVGKSDPNHHRGSTLTWNHNHNWPRGSYCPREDLGEKYPIEIYKGILTEEQVEFFSELCPNSDNGFHSVKKITVYEISKEQKIL